MPVVPHQQRLISLFDYSKDGLLFWKDKKLKKTGCLHHTGYWIICIDRKIFLAHRLVWVFHFGEIPINKTIDHIDGNKLNNRIENLRLATRIQNSCNKGICKANTTGLKGVVRSPRKNGPDRFIAYVSYNRKQTNLGTFDTPQLAHEAYKKAATELHGEFANF